MVDAEIARPVKNTISSLFDGENIEEAENYLVNSFGRRACFQRTPLHQACRYNNSAAMALLIANNADLEQKDIFGLTPLEICIKFGDEKWVAHFLACCGEAGRRVNVNEALLKLLCADKNVFAQLIDHGKMDKKATCFAFNYACSLLDQALAARLLDRGLDINKTMSPELNPVLEACTSKLLQAYGKAIEAQQDPANKAGASTLDDAKTAKPEEEKTYASVQEKRRAEQREKRRAAAKLKKQQALNALKSNSSAQELEKDRLDFIDFLFERGLDVRIAETKAPGYFADSIADLNSAALRTKLIDYGFSLEKKTTAKAPAAPSSTKATRDSKWSWELAGESVLFVETEPKQITQEQSILIRLSHNNVYGPVEQFQFFVRSADPNGSAATDESPDRDNWEPMRLVEEGLEADGTDLVSAAVDEPVYGETPWTATYECELSIVPGARAIEIKVASDLDNSKELIGVMPIGDGHRAN
jgi:hypothetical protein